MIEYILVDKETDEKVSHAYVDEADVAEWLELVDTTQYVVFKKVESGQD